MLLAARAQRREGLDHAGIGSRAPRDVGFVEREPARGQRVELGGRGRRAPATRQPFLDQRARPVADQAARDAFAQRLAAALDQQRVQRGGDVAGRVDQRAVEVEQERGCRVHASGLGRFATGRNNS
jgi:hypothetical protein